MRALVVWVHRWVGLVMALLLIIEGLTGSLLAYRADLTRWLAPELQVSAPGADAKRLDFPALAERAEQLVGPRAAVAYYFNSDDGPVTLRLRALTDPESGKPYPLDRPTIVLDPWTGRDLAPPVGEGVWRAFARKVMPFVYDLHTTLTLGATGSTILGIVALCWTLDCLWSFYLTLPPGGGRLSRWWTTAWTVRWRASAVRLNFDIHRAGGLWFWALLFIFAWSSVYLALPSAYDAVTRTLTDYVDTDQTLRNLPNRPRAVPVLGWRAAVAAGDRIIRDIATREQIAIARPLLIAYFPESDLYSYSVTTDRRFPRFSELNIYLDADTGALLSVNRPTGEHLGNTITSWLYSLHLVKDPVDHWSYRLLVCAVGIVTTLLVGTGIYIWWRKRAARRWARHRHEAAAGIVAEART